MYDPWEPIVDDDDDEYTEEELNELRKRQFAEELFIIVETSKRLKRENEEKKREREEKLEKNRCIQYVSSANCTKDQHPIRSFFKNILDIVIILVTRTPLVILNVSILTLIIAATFTCSGSMPDVYIIMGVFIFFVGTYCTFTYIVFIDDVHDYFKSVVVILIFAVIYMIYLGIGQLIFKLPMFQSLLEAPKTIIQWMRESISAY